MKRLANLIGREWNVDEVSRRLYEFAADLNAPAVGAMQVTCSDESERECVDAFQRNFAEYLLPMLKFGERSHFRLANLGGRYEWGAVHIAEQHYSTREAHDGFKLLLVKINSHVSVERVDRQWRFGRMERYASKSVYCGALHAWMSGASLPFVHELDEAMSLEGQDRLAVLLDEQRVEPQLRSLFAAVTHARLQARRALIDIQDRRPVSPTLFVVLPCVTLNRKQADTEIVCGVYRADWRSDVAEIGYQGLGDDPAAYRLRQQHQGTLVVEDHEVQAVRAARDHRELVLRQWEQYRDSLAEPSDPGLAPGTRRAAQAKLDEIYGEAGEGRHEDPGSVKPLLKTLLETLAQLNPISAVITLFAEGVADIHHLHRVQRLSRGVDGHPEARRILNEVQRKIDELPLRRAREVFELLVARHRT